MSVPDVSARPLAELLLLPGRVAVVTGGGNGIGAATVARLAEAGCDVVVADIDEGGAAAVADRVARETGRTIVATGADVRVERDVAAAADLAVERLGRLDVWVNNAGVYPPSPALSLDAGDWDTVLELNLRGAFLGAREAATRMIAGGHAGVIVNLASTASFRGNAALAAYAASKHGLLGLTKSLAVELGPHGIRVLAVAPTVVQTPGTDRLREGEGFAQRLDRGDTLPARRVGVPDDVARVIVFCASDLAVMMTGSCLLVDGGALAT